MNLGFLNRLYNYFERYIYTPTASSPGPLAAYTGWFQDLYGPSGLAKFWKGAENLVSCNHPDIVDNFQCTLDTIGMIPFLGEGADIINGVVYLVKKDYANALLSAGAIVPIVGAGFTGAKKFAKIYKHNPCGCLPAGTLIKTETGDKPIEDIKIGDRVLAKDTATGLQAYKPVEELFSFQSDQFVFLDVAGEQIETTANHPFWVKDKGWVAADELVIGDELETDEQAFEKIEGIQFVYNPSAVYNFTVKDFHTYYISEQGYLTHNLLDACRLDKYANVSKDVTTKGSVDSVILRAEIIKNTDIVPPAGWEAHHMVAVGAKNADADAARKILDKYKIKHNSSANGAFLPKSPGEVFTVIDDQTLATHNGGHTKTYYKYVYEKIKTAEDAGTNLADKETRVLNALNEIRTELLTGVTAIGKVK